MPGFVGLFGSDDVAGLVESLSPEVDVNGDGVCNGTGMSVIVGVTLYAVDHCPAMGT